MPPKKGGAIAEGTAAAAILVAAQRLYKLNMHKGSKSSKSSSSGGFWPFDKEPNVPETVAASGTVGGKRRTKRRHVRGGGVEDIKADINGLPEDETMGKLKEILLSMVDLMTMTMTQPPIEEPQIESPVEQLPVRKQKVDDNGDPVYDENGDPVYEGGRVKRRTRRTVRHHGGGGEEVGPYEGFGSLGSTQEGAQWGAATFPAVGGKRRVAKPKKH